MGILVYLQLMLWAPVLVNAGDANVPHIHPGNRVKPFKAGAPDVSLSGGDQTNLRAGKMIKRQIISEDGSGTALAVQDVEAHVSVVLARILDFSNYPKMVDGVTECGNYREVTHSNGTQTLMTRMVLSAAFIKFEGFFHHTYYPKLASVTWTLDYTRKSDFVDSVGYWYVANHPERPDTAARVFYSVNVIPGDWVPGYVVKLLQDKALDDAVAWVKKESEKQIPASISPNAPKRDSARSRDPESANSKRTLATFLQPDSLECIFWSITPRTASRPWPLSCDAKAAAALASARAAEAAALAERKESSWYAYFFE